MGLRGRVCFTGGAPSNLKIQKVGGVREIGRGRSCVGGAAAETRERVREKLAGLKPKFGGHRYLCRG